MRIGRRRAGVAVAVGLCLSAALAFGIYDWLNDRAEQIAVAEHWTVAGAPCPQVSAAAFRAYGVEPRQTYDYDDITWARAHGDVVCHDVRYGGGKGWGDYPVCQFNHPEVLTLITPGGAFHFAPGVGKPATVSVPHGRPRCVIGANADFMTLK